MVTVSAGRDVFPHRWSFRSWWFAVTGRVCCATYGHLSSIGALKVERKHRRLPRTVGSRLIREKRVSGLTPRGTSSEVPARGRCRAPKASIAIVSVSDLLSLLRIPSVTRDESSVVGFLAGLMRGRGDLFPASVGRMALVPWPWPAHDRPRR